MSLICSVCSNPVPEGVNQCRVCNRGFLSQLLCRDCGNMVVRGAASCPCAGQRRYEPRPLDVDVRPEGHFDGVMGIGQHLRQGEMVPFEEARRQRSLVRENEGYDSGSFGAISRVSVPDGVSVILSSIQSTVQALLDLANRLSHCPGHTDGTRHRIRECRDLASRLQEEFETRRGP